MAVPYIIPGSYSTNFAFLVSEADGYRSRTEGTVAAGAGVLKGGTFMGIITATGFYGPYTPAATDGTQTAAAILAEDCDATSAAVRRTFFDLDCELQRAELFFTGTPTTAQKNAAYASLAAKGIKMR